MMHTTCSFLVEHTTFDAVQTIGRPIQSRALDKREYLVIIRDNFCLFCFEPYVVTPHLNRLDETVQMRGHNIWF